MPFHDSHARRALMLCLCGMLLASCRSETEPQPARIVSGSMGERFYGKHWLVACGDCGFSFRCGVEHPPDDMLSICPNCGFRENRIEASTKQPGMAVEVVPRDFATHPPHRWEVIAFREPGGDHIAVKRVVGLPGERVAIRGGDLFIDGARAKKSLEEFHAQSQLIHDDAYLPTVSPNLPVRWRPAIDPSDWTPFKSAQQRGYRHTGGAAATASPDWLEYHHWSCAATPTPRDADSPIRDNDPYNQGLSRAMNAVSDVMLSFTVAELREVNDNSQLLVRLYAGLEPLIVSLFPNADMVRVLLGDRELAEAPTSTPLGSARNWTVSAGVVDRRLLVEISQQEVLALDLDSMDIEHDAPISLAVGMRDLAGTIANIKVTRDVYHLSPHARPDDWEMSSPLGEGEFFVLGDNPPLSRDSRHYGSIAIEQLVGSVRLRDE